jgi:lipopolysaccharide biosynthesis regulator YciM
MIQMLNQVLTLDPTHKEAAFELAVLEFNSHEFSKVLARLSVVTEISPSWATTYYAMLAYCYLHEQNLALARSFAVRAGQSARTDSDRMKAEQLLTRLMEK